jgi:hypothetical protein
MRNITRIQLEKNIDGTGVEGFLNLKEDFNFPINISISDIRNIGSRSGSFSKTCKLVGDKNNNLLLNNLFEVNTSFNNDFNINRKQRCSVIQNGVIIIDNCYIKILSTTKVQSNSGQLDDFVEYEVEIRDNIGDFFNEINNKEMTDLNLEEYNHVFDASTIINSFTHSWREGYSYTTPWINDSEYLLKEFAPGVFAKTYWDKIHSEAGYDYIWDELDDDNYKFDKLFIPYSGDEKKLTEEFIDSVKVKVDKLGFTQSLEMIEFQSSQTNLIAMPLVIDENEVDPDGLYDTTTSKWKAYSDISLPNTINYKIEVEWELSVKNPSFNTIRNGDVPVNSYIQTPNGVRPRLQVYGMQLPLQKGFKILEPTDIGLFGSDNDVVGELNLVGNPRAYVDSDGYINLHGRFFVGGSAKKSVCTGVETFMINTTSILNAEDLELRSLMQLRRQDDAYRWRDVNNVFLNGVKWVLDIKNIKIEIAPSLDNGILPGSLITMKSFVPKKLKQSEFIKAIVKKYNLYPEIDKDNSNLIRYKTRDLFYDSGLLKDWTFKLAKNKDQVLKFVPEIKNKRAILTYKDDDKDYLLTRYREEIGETYGQMEIIFDNENTRGTEVVESIFSPTMNLWTEFGSNVPVLPSGFKYNLRLLLHNGVKSCSNYTIKEDNVNIFTVNYYPFTSMLDEIVNPSYDISYGINDYYPYNIENFTSNNLYTNFWRRTFSQINNGKMLVAYFKLDELDIFELKLNDKIKVNNALWYINSIIDYDANNRGLTKVELLSVEDDLRLPEFGRIAKPFDGTFKPLPSNPKLPNGVGTAKPLLDALTNVIRDRDRLTSLVSFNGSISTGGRNNIQLESIVIGSGIEVKERGFYIDDTVLSSGSLYLDKKNYWDFRGARVGSILYGDNGQLLKSPYVDFDYWEDDYTISGGITASIIMTTDETTDETTVNITGDNILFNGVPLGYSNVSGVTGSSYSVSISDDVVMCDGGMSIYLPVAPDGKKIALKDYTGVALSNPIVVIPSSGLIDGSSSYLMGIDWIGIQVISYGGNWYII